MDLSMRATESELLDEGVPESEALESLADLRRVNRWLGTHRRFAEGDARVSLVFPSPPPPRRGVRLGDIPESIAGPFRVRSWPWGSTSRCCTCARRRRRCGAWWPMCTPALFRAKPSTWLLACHFLHHFDGTEAAAVLRRLYALARRALIVDDIRRARVPYVFARSLSPCCFAPA